MEKIPESPLEDMLEEPLINNEINTTIVNANANAIANANANAQHYVVIDYNTNVYCTNKLMFKLKDIYKCESTILFENNLHTLFHNKINCPKQNTTINIFLTYYYDYNNKKKELTRGFLYKNNTEYEIYYYKIFTSFKIFNKVYDKIAICKIKLN